MEEIIKQKCRAYFEAANEAEEVYVAGDKLFVDDGAARSYGEVVKVKRSEVMEAEATGATGSGGGLEATGEPSGEQKRAYNDKKEE